MALRRPHKRNENGRTLPLWIPAFAGMTVALRRPHKRMKMAGRLVPVDSRFRGNDGVGLPSIFIAMTVWVCLLFS